MYIYNYNFLLKQMGLTCFILMNMYIFIVENYSTFLITINIYECVHMYLSHSDLLSDLIQIYVST